MQVEPLSSKLKEILEQISFPRFSGTSGGKRAANFIVNFLKRNGYEISREKFYVPDPEKSSYFNIFYYFLFFLAAIFLFLNILLVALVTGAIYSIIKLNEFRIELKLGKIELENIRAFRGKKFGRKTVLLTSHYDTARTLNPTVRKMINYYIFDFFDLLKYFVFFLVLLFFIGQFYNFAFFVMLSAKIKIVWGFILFLSLFSLCAKILSLVFLKKEYLNGADDNASGTAVSLYLSELLKNKNLDSEFLFTAGEELGFLGAKEWINSNKSLSETMTVVNIDTVGRGEYFLLNKGWNFANKVRSDPKINLTLKGVLKGKKYLNMWNDFSDAYIFAKNNFKVVSITRKNRIELNLFDKFLGRLFKLPKEINSAGYAPWIHTNVDNLKNIDYEKMDESAHLVLSLMKKLK